MNRRRKLMRNIVLMGGIKAKYTQKIIDTGPIAYWPMNETSGTDELNYGSIVGGKGTYNGVTLAQIAAPGSGLAPLWDGGNDLADNFSAALAAAFDGALGSAMIWWKVSAAGVWTDATERYILVLYTAANTHIDFNKTTTDDQVQFIYNFALGSFVTLNSTAYNNTNWNQMALTWTDAGNEIIWYNNGAQTGATQASPGTWVGALTAANHGSYGASKYWSGYLAHATIWDRVLTPAEILALYNGGL